MYSKLRVTVLVGAIMSLLLIAGMFFWLSYHSLTIQFTAPSEQGVTIELYNAKYEEESHQSSLGGKVQDITSGESVWLHDGMYAIRTSGKDYAENIQYISLQGEDQTVSYSLRYSREHLDKLQAEEVSAAHTTIEQAYPTTTTLYKYSGDMLLGEGNWFVVFLYYQGDDDLQRDTLRLVLHKEKGAWKLASKPQLSIGQPDHPEIPIEVLNYANKELPDPLRKSER